MKREERKRQKKREREREKHKRSAAYAAEKNIRAKKLDRPRVLVDPTGGDPVLVRRVQDAAKRISLEASGGCPADVAELVERFRRDGPDETVRHLRAQAALRYDHHQEIINESQLVQHRAIAHVGQQIFEQLPEVYQRKLLPEHYFYPMFVPEGILIEFGFMERVKRDTGWGYYAKREPKVRINNAEWVVCFSSHAIERVVERSCFEERLTYAHYMDCAAYFQGCVYFEPVMMEDGTPAIRLFMMENLGGPPQRYREYLKKVAGIEDVLQYAAIPAYVLGYCHVDCKGRFAKAISCWYPGYRGTPEDTLVRSADLSKAERQRLLALADDNKTVRVINEGRHEAIRWYHEHGVPQVIYPERRLFEWVQN